MYIDMTKQANVAGERRYWAPSLFLFYLYLVSLGWGPVFRNVAGFATLRIDELLLIFLIIVILLQIMIKKRQILPMPRPFMYTWGVYIFLATCATLQQAVLIKVEDLRPLWALARMLLLTIVFYVSYFLGRRYKEHIGVMFDLFLIISLGIAILGILQWFNVDGTKVFVEKYYPRVTTYVPHAATSVFGGNPTIMGTFLAIVISFLFARLLSLGRKLWMKVLLLLVLGILLFTLVLTASKLAILACVTVIFFLLLLSQKREPRSLILMGIICVGILWLTRVVAPYALMRMEVSVEPSISGRWETWACLMEHVLANLPTLLFGNAFLAEVLGAPDSAYIYELVYYGILGLLGYVLFVFGNLFSVLRLFLKIREPYRRALCTGAVGMLLTIAIVGVGYATISAERLSELFFVLLGMTYGLTSAKTASSLTSQCKTDGDGGTLCWTRQWQAR
jgi:hypothetical protein